MDIPGIRADGTAVVLSGQPFALAVQIEDDAGALQVLDGRSFALIFRPTRGTASIIDSPVSATGSGTSVALAYGGTDTATIAAALRSQAGRCEVVEIVGEETLRVFDWPVLAELAATFDSGQPGSGDLPQTLVVVQPATGHVMISQQGAAGASSAAAAQSLILAGEAKAAADAAAASASGAAGLATTAAAQAAAATTAAQAAAAAVANTAGLIAYNLQPGGAGIDDTANLRTLLTSTTILHSRPAPASYVFAPPPWTGNLNQPTPSLITVSGKAIIDHDMSASVSTEIWNGTSPDKSLFVPYDFRQIDEVRLRLPRVTYSPMLSVQGVVSTIATDKLTYKITLDAGYVGAFTSADFANVYDRTTGYPIAWQYQDDVDDIADDEGDGPAYPVTINGDGTLTVQPPARTVSGGTVSGTSPLTIVFPAAHGISDGARITFTAGAGTIGALLNGGQYLFNKIDDLTGEIDYNQSTPVDATGLTGTIGNLALVVIPPEMIVGVGANLISRKRGGGLVRLIDVGRAMIDGEVNACPGIMARGRNVGLLEVPGFTAVGRKPSGASIEPWYTAGGGFVVQDLRQFRAGTIRARGIGDDLFNFLPRYWDRYVTDHGRMLGTTLAPNQMVVTFAAPGDPYTNNPSLPLYGDTIETWDSSTMILDFAGGVRTIVGLTFLANVTGGASWRVDLSGDLPVAYVPSTRNQNNWFTINRSACVTGEVDEVHAEQLKARLLILQGKWRQRLMYLKNGHAAIRAKFPASSHHASTGGYCGGGWFGEVLLRDSYLNTGGDAMFQLTRLLAGGGMPTARSQFEPMRHDVVDAARTGYGLGYYVGWDYDAGYVHQRQIGLFRALNPRTAGDLNSYLNYDWYAVQAAIRLGIVNSDQDILLYAGPGSVIEIGKVEGGVGVKYVRDPTATIIIEGAVQKGLSS